MDAGERTPILDELSSGRKVFRELYRAADRRPPDWLLDAPVSPYLPIGRPYKKPRAMTLRAEVELDESGAISIARSMD